MNVTINPALTLLAALLFAPLAARPAADAPAQPAGGKPNIVLILADDLGYGSLGCYGCSEVKTPNIDRLAASGVRLTDFHSNGAMCSPTRASLMTGRYQQRCAWIPDEELSPIFQAQRKENIKQRWAWGISTNELTLPALLRQAGYRTALIGKWHLGYDLRFHPMNYSFDEFRGYVGGNVDYHTHVAGYGTKELDWWKEKKIQNEPGYTTDLLARYATNFIARNKDHPFFLYLAHEAPHEPWQGRDPARKKSPAETYKEMVGVLDECMGIVIEALRQDHLETNTLVIFCSDNGPAAPPGFAANGGLTGRKGSMFEGGHRVPFIASWPGVIAGGTTRSEVALTMDFLPTFAKLAGATVPSGHQIDGVDVMPLLKGDARMSDRVLYWMFGEKWAVRRGEWKLIGKGVEALTLVNLENDLAEKNNLIKAKPELADELMKLHRQWIAEVGNR
jgi:arylsulfatase A-like enzyme